MHRNYDLNFMRERIEEIGSAIFHNLSNSVLKLPTSVVSTLKVDEYGFIWFLVQKPKQELKEFEQEFPTKMDFYRKGAGYFLQVYGKGYVVTDPEEMNAFVNLPEDLKKLATSDYVLVKVKIQQGDCFETVGMNKTSWWQSALANISSWFGYQLRPGHTYSPAS